MVSLRSGMLGVLVVATLGVAPVVAVESDPESCELVRDDLNDTVVAGRPETTGHVPQRDIDIVSADVATDERLLYAVIRVHDLNRTQFMPGATRYRLEFTVGSRRLFVQADPRFATTWAESQHRWSFAHAGRVGGRAWPVYGYVDHFDDAIVVNAPLKVFGARGIEPGSIVTSFRVSASRRVVDEGQVAPGVTLLVGARDDAASDHTYVAGEPSCISPVHEPKPFPYDPQPAPEPTKSAQPQPQPYPTVTPGHPSPSPSPTPTPERTEEEPAEEEPGEEEPAEEEPGEEEPGEEEPP